MSRLGLHGRTLLKNVPVLTKHLHSSSLETTQLLLLLLLLLRLQSCVQSVVVSS